MTTSIKEINRIAKRGRYHFEILKNNSRAQCTSGCPCTQLHRAMGDYVLAHQKEGVFGAPKSAPKWLQKELEMLASNLLAYSPERGAWLVDREEQE